MRTRRSLAALAALVAVLLAGCSTKPVKLSQARTTTTASAPTAAPTTSTLPLGTSLVAQATVPQVQVYAQPSTSGAPTTTLSNPTQVGAPLVFLVKQQQGAWLDVNLPIRPNGSTGWIQAGQVRLSYDPYRLVVELGAHRLTLYKDGSSVVMQVPIGVGTQDTPTPGGVFYIKELLKPPNPDGDYGPYAYGLSGFTEVASLANFNGGQGVIGIHGTNHPELVGTSVSHGCIRLKNDDITKLAGILPLGTPVDIQA